MKEKTIKKLLKKYETDFKGRKFIEQQFLGRKIHKRSIRSKICTQNENIQKLYCLLSGSVEISYTLTHEIKAKHFENDEEKQTLHKMPKTENFKITFLIIEASLEFINQEAILQHIQKQESLQQQHLNRSLNHSVDSSKSKSSRKSLKKTQQSFIKSKYTAIVTSSECEYIEVTFQEAKILLGFRLQQIRQRDLERQSLIKEKKTSLKLELQGNQRKQMLEKISMLNLKKRLKFNISPKYKDLTSLVGLEKKVLTTMHDFRQNSGKKQTEPSENKNLPEPIKKIRSVSQIPPSLQDKNPFGKSLELFNQDQLILQKYRSKQQLKNVNFNPNRMNSLLMPKKDIQQRIFKENLKKIIRKKLKFEKIHGQIIRENVYGVHDDMIEISNEYEYPIENSENNSQNHQMYHESQALAPRLHHPKFKKPEPIGILPTFNIHTTKSQYSLHKEKNSSITSRVFATKKLLKNQLQKQSKQLESLRKMRKKIQEQEMFLKLQDLDSYFNKI